MNMCSSGKALFATPVRSASALRSPTGYGGIYASWNIGVDGQD